MTIGLKRINKQVVKAIPLPNEDLRPIKGFDICSEVYANIFLCARKKSGKTSAVNKIIKECADKRTVLVIFCSTIYKDQNWIEIRKRYEKKGMDVRVHTSLYEDGVDQLADLIEDLRQEAKQEEEDKAQEDQNVEDLYEDCEPENEDILDRLTKMYNHSQGQTKFSLRTMDEFNDPEKMEQKKKEVRKQKKKKEGKYLAPQYMIIFDDLSSELKSRSLLSLLKFNRHFKSKLIISSQWLHDLLPESRKQIDLFLIFKGFPEDKLALIYKDSDSSIPFELFYKIYKKATVLPHSFMYIDTREDEFRRNFDCKFILDHEKEENDKTQKHSHPHWLVEPSEPLDKYNDDISEENEEKVMKKHKKKHKKKKHKKRKNVSE